MNLLFVCSRNRRRSPTAEVTFSSCEGVNATSAGTSVDAETPVSADLIEWADLVFAMENTHRRKLQQRFDQVLRTKQVIVLGIPDRFEYMDARLVQLLMEKVTPYLKARGLKNASLLPD